MAADTGAATVSAPPPATGTLFPAASPSAAGPGSAAGRAWLWSAMGLTIAAVTVTAVLAPPASAHPGPALSWLLFAGSSVHVAATGWLFTVRDVRVQAARHRARYLAVPAALAAAATLLAVALPPSVLRWLLLPYFGWQFFHFQKQNLGLTALAASACRLPPLRPGERRALLLAGWTGIAVLLSRPGLLGLGITARTGVAAPLAAAGFAVAAAGFAALTLVGLWMLAHRPASARPPVFTAMYLMALLFPAPLFLFRSPYAAAGGLTAAHGLQYLLLVGLFAAAPGGRRPRLLGLAALANIALAGGAALSAASHLHGAAPGGRLLFGAYLGAVMAHFVIDAGLWRMRDPAVRSLLTTRLPALVPPRACDPQAAYIHDPHPAQARDRLPRPARDPYPATDRSVTGIGSRP